MYIYRMQLLRQPIKLEGKTTVFYGIHVFEYRGSLKNVFITFRAKRLNHGSKQEEMIHTGL